VGFKVAGLLTHCQRLGVLVECVSRVQSGERYSGFEAIIQLLFN
jgi:hypothetical protein